MKRKLLFLALLFVGLVGCTYNTLPDDVATPIVATEQGFDLSFATRAEVFDGQSLDNKYFVAEQDLESFLNYKQQHSDKKIIVKDCTPYGFDGSHTLFYVLNYADGWEVVSADKRTQATLAYGNGSRTFSMGADNANEAEKFWMELLASDVLQKRQRGGIKDGARLPNEEIANDEEERNVDFWNKICATNNGVGTRAIEVSSTSDLRTSPYDNVYLLGSTIDTMAVDKGPYIQTQWDQGHPWNEFCPLITEAGNSRSLAGCTIVAGGQLLYYLHQKTGNVMFAPANVDVVGTIDNYQYTFYNYTNAAWSAMALTASEYEPEMPDGPTQLVATLLSWIGSNCHVSFGDYEAGTGAHPYYLFNWMEREFGITSDVEYSHSSAIIKQELAIKLHPIFIAAGDHAWLADGFRTVMRVDTVYYFVTDEELTMDEVSRYSFDDATHFIEYELDVDYYAHMNWGWGGSYDGYYSLLSDDWDPLGIPFNIAVNIYYNIGFDE